MVKMLTVQVYNRYRLVSLRRINGEITNDSLTKIMAGAIISMLANFEMEMIDAISAGTGSRDYHAL